MGYEDYHFMLACAFGGLIFGICGVSYNYIVYGHLPEFLTSPSSRGPWMHYGNFMERTNPKAKYCFYSARYITDPIAKMRPLPKNPEKYFTIDTLKKISYRLNKDNPSFGL